MNLSEKSWYKRLFQGVLKKAWTKLIYWLKREKDYHQVNIVDTVFFLTYRCSSKCKTCTMWQRGGKSEEMDLNGWKKVVDESYKNGAKWIEIFGGDALIRKDVLIPLIKHIKTHEGLKVHMPTNCNLLDKEMAYDLVNAGLDDIWLSIDAVDIAHDSVRGVEGTFSRVQNAIKFLLEARGDREYPIINANCTISKFNVHKFEKVLDYCEELGIDAMHLAYVGEFDDNCISKCTYKGITPTPYFISQKGETSLLSKEEAKIFKSKIDELRVRALKSKVEVNLRNVDKLSLKNLYQGKFDNKRCNIIRTKLSVDPKGNVIGCPFFDTVRFGNILEADLNKIWNNQEHKDFILGFKKNQLGICEKCILGVERNHTFLQDVRDEFNYLLQKGRQ